MKYFFEDHTTSRQHHPNIHIHHIHKQHGTQFTPGITPQLILRGGQNWALDFRNTWFLQSGIPCPCSDWLRKVQLFSKLLLDWDWKKLLLSWPTHSSNLITPFSALLYIMAFVYSCGCHSIWWSQSVFLVDLNIGNPHSQDCKFIKCILNNVQD